LFELPLLNTVILLSSGVLVTYFHHCLIQGNRRGALYGNIATIILAILFTVLQGLEYTVSSFTISDGVYGSCFYFGTGFHGLITSVVLYICIYTKFKINNINNFKIHNLEFSNKLLINVPSYKDIKSYYFYLDKSFLE